MSVTVFAPCDPMTVGAKEYRCKPATIDHYKHRPPVLNVDSMSAVIRDWVDLSRCGVGRVHTS